MRDNADKYAAAWEGGRDLRTARLLPLIGLTAALMLSNGWGKELGGTTTEASAEGNGVAPVVGHPFSAIKYAWQVRALPGGRQQFIRNERYPSGIARDADGRVMMQVLRTDDLQPECDHLEMLVPPVCPVWEVFVIDPITRTLAHWPEGERAAHIAVDFPLTEAQLEQAARATAELPELPPDFSDEDGKLTTADLGERTIESVPAHGVRTTLEYTKTESGRTVSFVRIHEVWSTPKMELIIRVIDGDPNGIETEWGLKNITIAPDTALFQPPAGYVWQHRNDEWERRHPDFAATDFEYLDLWFSK